MTLARIMKLALCQLDETFAESYGSLFENPEEIADHTLYRVDRQSGLLSLAGK